GPLARDRRVGVLGRAAALLRLREQGLVVLLRGLERIRAHDRLTRIVAIAMPPRRRGRRILTDQAVAVAAPEILERRRAVAAEVARVAPELPVLVEVFRGEQIDGQRLDAGRRLAVPRRTYEAVRLPARVVRDLALAGSAETSADRRARHVEIVEVGGKRRASADARETDVGRLLRERGSAEQRSRNEHGKAEGAVRHSHPPTYRTLVRQTLPSGSGRCREAPERYRQGSTAA